MSRKTLFIFIIALVALTVISWDYTAGHTLEDMLKLEYCPICDAFHNTASVVYLLCILACLGLIPISANHFIRFNPSLRSLFDPQIISNRAPPACA